MTTAPPPLPIPLLNGHSCRAERTAKCPCVLAVGTSTEPPWNQQPLSAASGQRATVRRSLPRYPGDAFVPQPSSGRIGPKPDVNQALGLTERAHAALSLNQGDRPWKRGRCTPNSGHAWRHGDRRRLRSGKGLLLYKFAWRQAIHQCLQPWHVRPGEAPRRSSSDEVQVFGKQLGGADAVSNLSRM